MKHSKNTDVDPTTPPLELNDIFFMSELRASIRDARFNIQEYIKNTDRPHPAMIAHYSWLENYPHDWGLCMNAEQMEYAIQVEEQRWNALVKIGALSCECCGTDYYDTESIARIRGPLL